MISPWRVPAPGEALRTGTIPIFFVIPTFSRQGKSAHLSPNERFQNVQFNQGPIVSPLTPPREIPYRKPEPRDTREKVSTIKSGTR